MFTAFTKLFCRISFLIYLGVIIVNAFLVVQVVQKNQSSVATAHVQVVLLAVFVKTPSMMRNIHAVNANVNKKEGAHEDAILARVAISLKVTWHTVIHVAV